MGEHSSRRGLHSAAFDGVNRFYVDRAHSELGESLHTPSRRSIGSRPPRCFTRNLRRADFAAKNAELRDRLEHTRARLDELTASGDGVAEGRSPSRRAGRGLQLSYLASRPGGDAHGRTYPRYRAEARARSATQQAPHAGAGVRVRDASRSAVALSRARQDGKATRFRPRPADPRTSPVRVASRPRPRRRSFGKRSTGRRGRTTGRWPYDGFPGTSGRRSSRRMRWPSSSLPSSRVTQAFHGTARSVQNRSSSSTCDVYSMSTTAHAASASTPAESSRRRSMRQRGEHPPADESRAPGAR